VPEAARQLAEQLLAAAPARPARVRAWGVRAGLSPLAGVLGAGVEHHRGRVAFALGTGRYALSGGVSLALREGGGPYLDLFGVWVHRSVFGDVTGPGAAVGATVGWDLRPADWLSLKAGLGPVWNSALAGDVNGRWLAYELSAGVLF
jgi:hypothetical protein